MEHVGELFITIMSKLGLWRKPPKKTPEQIEQELFDKNLQWVRTHYPYTPELKIYTVAQWLTEGDMKSLTQPRVRQSWKFWEYKSQEPDWEQATLLGEKIRKYMEQ